MRLHARLSERSYDPLKKEYQGLAREHRKSVAMTIDNWAGHKKEKLKIPHLQYVRMEYL